MNMDFAHAMRAAMRLTRAQKLMDATRVIQNALSGREQAPLQPSSKRAAKSRSIEARVIDLTAHVIEPRFGLDALVGVRSRKALDIPDGAQFLSRSFACAAGSRS